jgi:hypothetical protein
MSETLKSQPCRFTIWTIAKIVGLDVKKDGEWPLISRESMSQDEKKWVWLRWKGLRNDDEWGVKATLDDWEVELEDYVAFDDDDDVDEKLSDEMKQNCQVINNDEEEENILVNKKMVNNTMIDMPKFLKALKAVGCPEIDRKSINELAQNEGVKVGYGIEWVMKSDIDDQMKIMTTPKKKLLTDDQKKKILKEKQESNEKIVMEMGLGDDKVVMGELMRKLRQSVEVGYNESSNDLNTMEGRVYDGMGIDSMVEMVKQIEAQLAKANNRGVRLVAMRGQIFALYQKINLGTNHTTTGEVFGVSTSVVATSRSFANLIITYPTFRKVTLPFTTIVRNMARIKKWLLECSQDDG